MKVELKLGFEINFPLYKNLRWESTKNLEVKKFSVFLPEEYEVERCVEKKVIH